MINWKSPMTWLVIAILNVLAAVYVYQSGPMYYITTLCVVGSGFMFGFYLFDWLKEKGVL